MNRLAVRFNYVFADGKTQTGTTLIAAAGRISSVKAFKDARQVLFFDPNSIVTYFCQYMFTVSCIYTRFNVSSILSVLESIFCEVDQYLSYFLFVGKNDNGSFTTFFDTAGHLLFLQFNGK